MDASSLKYGKRFQALPRILSSCTKKTLTHRYMEDSRTWKTDSSSLLRSPPPGSLPCHGQTFEYDYPAIGWSYQRKTPHPFPISSTKMVKNCHIRELYSISYPLWLVKAQYFPRSGLLNQPNPRHSNLVGCWSMDIIHVMGICWLSIIVWSENLSVGWSFDKKKNISFCVG